MTQFCYNSSIIEPRKEFFYECSFHCYNDASLHYAILFMPKIFRALSGKGKYGISGLYHLQRRNCSADLLYVYGVFLFRFSANNTVGSLERGCFIRLQYLLDQSRTKWPIFYFNGISGSRRHHPSLPRFNICLSRNTLCWENFFNSRNFDRRIYDQPKKRRNCLYPKKACFSLPVPDWHFSTVLTEHC